MSDQSDMSDSSFQLFSFSAFQLLPMPPPQATRATVLAAVLAATGWTRSTLTQADLDRLFPPPPEPTWEEAGFLTPMGWRLGWTPDRVALLTGLYVLASRAAQLGIDQPCVVTDMSGERHTLTFQEFEQLMLAYGAARAAASAGGEA
jgi:hypothetical protein